MNQIVCASVLDWMAAIGPFVVGGFAVFIAIFRDWLRGLYWHPTLEFEIGAGPPYSYKIPNIPKKNGPITAYYFTARVRNDGQTTARDVTVFAPSLEKRDENTGLWMPVKGFLPMELVWAHVRDPLTGARFFNKQVIPQKLFTHFDIGCIEQTSETKHADIRNLVGNQEEETVFKIDTIVIPNTLTNWLREGEYRLCLVASATNAKPVKRYFVIENRGVWSDDEEKMFKDNLRIKMIRP